MTANRSQYMILDAEESTTNVTQRDRQERNRAFGQLQPIQSIFTPSRQELEEIAYNLHPEETRQERQRRVQQMQR